VYLCVPASCSLFCILILKWNTNPQPFSESSKVEVNERAKEQQTQRAAVKLPPLWEIYDVNFYQF
jgi:hypothetical protein